VVRTHALAHNNAMKFPDLLQSRNGRLATFFLLYITEGIPLGFAATAMATQMRRQGISAGEIGAFVGAIYLPWAFKWAIGPVVDVISSDRFGRRRTWIIAMQVMMALSLISIQWFGITAGVAALTTLIVIHNCFAATQDVAIDALAVGVLRDDERGVAGGLMFGAQYLGQAVGASGALFLASRIGFDNTYYFIAAAILAITVFVVLPMHEPTSGRAAVPDGRSRLRHAGFEMRAFLHEAWRSITACRAAWMGIFFAVLPCGAMALGLALLTNLAVDLGMSDDQVGSLNLWTTLIAAVGCVAGGWLSDHYGRRRSLTVFVLIMSPPTLWLAWTLWQAGWINPVIAANKGALVISATLVTTFWLAAMIYSLGNGLMYGARAGLLMDITNPRVAATQFTAYMAMMNLGIANSSRWQGWATDRYGYATTLLADAGVGLVCLIPLFLMGEIRRPEPASVAHSQQFVE
jgi:PAT family beta-lactamase induction signal transducer AmpG